MADGYGIAPGYHIHDLKKLLDVLVSPENTSGM